MIAQLIALPTQVAVSSVFVGGALYLLFWAFRNWR
jgi:hypothetical protein